jgi:hypothetical protein
MHILVITSCTGKKAFKPPNALKVMDFEKGKDHIIRREEELSKFVLPAHAMYTGQQHKQLMRGIRECPPLESIDLRILSAGYGLIPGDRRIAPYECTFKGMKSKELRRWGDALSVPEDFRQVVATKYDLGILLLGKEYLESCRFDATVRFGGRTIAFCGSTDARRLCQLGLEYLRVEQIPHSASKNIWLKGALGAQLLKGVFTGTLTRSQLADPGFDLLKALLKALKEVRP